MADEADKGKDDWWRTADLGECPITLECFSTLGYPPFALYHPGKIPTTANDACVSAYFDGLALASYIVSRGVFQNPLTRAELTAEDCRRLDRYLQAHCYSGDAAIASSATIFRGSRVISVAEAFCLRNSVSVETTTTTSRQSNNERDRERIRTLQNAATAALAGLFVYGNDRSRFENNDEIPQSVPGFRSETDALLNDWGFDLSRQVEQDISAQGTHGYSVIDVDEAIEVASRRQAYESVQEAFPPLRDNDDTAREFTMTSPDEKVMERIRTLSARDEEEKRRHALKLELARAQLLRQALERRKQRQEDCADCLARGAKTYASQQKDKEELERARKEIEAWRDDQWEKLRLLSEQQQGKQKEIQNKLLPDSLSGNQNGNSHEGADGSDKEMAEAVVDDAEERKKAKAAAKRKRAKERKKAKKALEKEEAEKSRLKEAEKAQRAASALKCAACGTGILKPSLAFERFDLLFCTPKCARTAVKPG